MKATFLAVSLIALCGSLAAAQPGPAASSPAPAATAGLSASAAPADPAAQVDALRQGLKAAYQRGDIQGMLKYLHPQVVIIFPDGQVLQGRDALASYYEKMLKGPGHIVSSYSSDPVVTQRYLHEDTVVSFGRMNDRYVLTDGTEFGLDSRFTVTAMRLPEGPAETGGWTVRSFHSSTNAFDNPVLHLAVERAGRYAGLGGGAVGLIVGGLLVWLAGRRGRAPAPN